ncbi:hypothetical protein [Paenibacillus sp. Soil522]|nr:hypothetical protein [Paenibacillus sp. Soil522]
MFKIGEFSKLQGICQNVAILRELGLLNPASVDEVSEYRNYATNQLS